MPAPRVILVAPQNPANVGFCARVLANFGLDDWVLVAAPEWRGSEAERTGAPARQTLEASRRASTLAEAASGCTHLCGFTGRAGRHRRLLPLAEFPAAVAAWGPRARPALVFGREDRGLEAGEVESCSLLVTIPVPGLASLNLSHALAVVLYEWFRAGLVPPAASESISWAGVEDRERLARKALEELAAADFPDPGGETAATLRRLAAAPMEARDLRVLEKILRHARWRRS
jgi:tRNA/rRNA methyltransferase